MANDDQVHFPSGAFAGNFDRLLGIHRLSARNAANLLGVSATTLSYWRTGKREPTVPSLKRVCDFFEVDMWLLLSAPAAEFVDVVLGNRDRFELVERRIRGEFARGDTTPGALRREAEGESVSPVGAAGGVSRVRREGGAGELRKLRPDEREG